MSVGSVGAPQAPRLNQYAPGGATAAPTAPLNQYAPPPAPMPPLAVEPREEGEGWGILDRIAEAIGLMNPRQPVPYGAIDHTAEYAAIRAASPGFFGAQAAAPPPGMYVTTAVQPRSRITTTHVVVAGAVVLVVGYLVMRKRRP